MWTIGEVRVTEIAELTTTSAAHWLIPDATAERIREIEWMLPHYATPDGKVHMTMRALVIESEGRRILVDTCLGNDKQRPVESWNMRSGPFLDDLDAGLVDLVRTDERLAAHVTLVPTPGYTPGHVSVAIESAGDRAVITGDLSHMVCQAAHPEWGSSFDVDPVGAEATRRAFFAQRADTDELVLGTHWQPCAGYVRSDGSVWRVVPADA